MAQIDITIGGISKAKAELESLKEAINNAEDSGKKSELKERYDDLSKSLINANKKFVELEQSGKRMSARFDEIYGDIQPLSGRIGELEDRLYELALAGEQNTDEFKNIQKEVGNMKKVIIDVDKSVDLLSENQGFSVFGTGLSQVGERLMSLDFVGAAKDATALNNSVGNLGQMGGQALKGLSTTVVQLGKAFMSVGLSLLTNPIFLIAAAIVALVAIIVLLMNKLGILKPILNAIGKVFGWIMKIIDGVIEGFRMLTDWLGLTANAAEDSAKRQIAASEKTLETLEKTSESTIDSMDHQIRLAKIAGEDVALAEAKKQKYIIQTTQIRINELAKQVKIHEQLGDLEEADLQKLKDSLAEQKKALREAGQDFEALRAENKKKVEENAKKVADNEKKVNEERRANAKAYANDRLAAARLLQDMELDLMDEGVDKEILANKIKYQRLIEDTKNNEKLLSAEKTKQIALLKEQEEMAKRSINEKYLQEEQAALLKIQEDRKAKEEQEKADFLARTEADRQAQKEAQKKANDERLAQEKAFKEARLNLGSDLVKGLQGLEQLLTQAGVKTAGLQKTIALVQIATDTAKAISATIAGATAAAAAGGPAAPFLLAGYIASGIGTVLGAVASAYAALKKAPPIGGAVSGSAPSAPSNSTNQAATPNVSLFGQNNNANNLSSVQSQESTSGEMVVKAVVVESDITNAQNKANKFQNLATL